MSVPKLGFKPGDRVQIRPAGSATLVEMVYTYPDTQNCVWKVKLDRPWEGGGATLDGYPIWSDSRFTFIGHPDPDFCGPV